MKHARVSDYQSGDANWRASQAEGGHHAIDTSRYAAITRTVGFHSSARLRQGLPQRDPLQNAAHMRHTRDAFEFNGKTVPITFLTPRSGGRYLDDYMRAVSHTMRAQNLRGGEVTLRLHRNADTLEIPANMPNVKIMAANGSPATINHLILGANTRRVRLGIRAPTYLSSRNEHGELVAETLENVRARGVNIHMLGAANMTNAEVRDISFRGPATAQSLRMSYGNINGMAPDAAQIYDMAHPTPAARQTVGQVMRSAVHAARAAAAKLRMLMPPEPMARHRDPYANLAA